ncbi:hypothetical protein K1T71_001521 [Dendrolimus kikuchii]|uniref:Uncharacterized protein n=1 Tax=Dendrolimus kikuchii TaxID=765133 RepID=A0ACC1DI59_9NEOP|nr:hypothetical protein K1T71_001521 [Dendrolimus kikuchii]
MVLLNLFSSLKFINKTIKYYRITIRSCCGTPQGPQSATSEPKMVEGNKKGVVLGVYETGNKLELTPAAEEFNQKSGGKITQRLNEFSSDLTLGKAFVLTDVSEEYSAVALSSYGSKSAGYNELETLDESRENVRWGVGAGVRLLEQRGCSEVLVDAGGAPDAAAEAAELAAWRFEEFRSRGVRPECAVGALGAGGEQWRAGRVRGRAQNWARLLADMPANKMAPVDLAQAALDALCPLGVRVEAHDREWASAQRMEAFLAVARGSCEEPVFLECVYRGAGDTQPPVLLAAKGITFDSGGLCLKRASDMSENRGSMAGAAVALAALKTIAELKVPINVCAVIPICENMVSGQCMKVGDVVTALNGMSIQVEDTDLEGRLLLADALVYGQARHRPALLLDVATLTKGVLLATGGGAFGCFASDAHAWAAARAAGAHTGDRPWRFPLWHYYHKQITDDPSVDLRNKGAGKATPCLGAAFLKNFVCCDWLHCDITGVGKVGHSPAPPYLHPRRMTGRPTRTIATIIQNIADANATSQNAHA